MSKFIIIALALLTSATAFAQSNASGTDGCGLGWQITQKKTFSATSTRGTTNSVIPPTFGMTSGTLGCSQHSLVKADMKPLHYADANYENLMTEIAEGQGEYLTGFAVTMGCTPSNEFASTLQSNFDSIVNGSTPGELVRNIRTIIRSNPALASTCQA